MDKLSTRARKWAIEFSVVGWSTTYQLSFPAPLTEWAAAGFAFNRLISEYGNEIAERATIRATPLDLTPTSP